MLTTLVGTSGFSYAAWKGSFYPPDIAADAMLSHYAQHFACVEINNTFYRMPRSDVLSRWAQQVPGDFRFAIKASRRITHQRRLRDARDNLAYLYGQLDALGDRLGAVLFQLPPQLRKDVARLDEFLRALPADGRAVIEFRHDSWFCDEVHARLATAGVASCTADHDPEDGTPSAPLWSTARWGYARLRRRRYTDDELAEWLARLREPELGWDRVFVFFMHEDPEPAARFERLASAG